jgi:plastocyanin
MTISRRVLLTRALGAAAALPLIALPARAASHTVTISGMAFVPADLTVAAGDSVTFVNEDAAPHTATAEAGGFDTGRLGRGESATLTFGSAGTYAYFCAVHPMMKGTITVA